MPRRTSITVGVCAGAGVRPPVRCRSASAGAALVLLSVALAAPAASQWAMLAERSQGRAEAPVTIFEMSDFQCPYCRQFAMETLPALLHEYVASGKVRFVFVNFPLTEVHPWAFFAADVAMCAAAQGAFWRFHDLAFQRQPEWSRQPDPSPYLQALADSAGARPAALARCLANKTGESLVEADQATATRLGAQTTPTFFIEGGLIEGAAPIEVFRQVLDSVYQAKTATPAH